MFLGTLNDEQKRTLWAIAYQLVVSDHRVSKKEGELLDELTNGLRTKIRVSPQRLLEKPDLSCFDTREARVAALLEILTLAVGDNDFPDHESRMVRSFGHELGFGDEEYGVMKEWAVKNSALLDEAVRLMDERHPYASRGLF